MSTSTERMRRLRERRAGDQRAEARRLYSADDLLLPALHATITALELGPEFDGVAELARHFARAIDGALDAGPKVYASTLRWLGPELQKTLETLGATPAARAKLKPVGKPGPVRQSRLVQLRAADAAGRRPDFL